MDRPSRLRRNEDFQRARREGRSWATTWLVLVAAANGLDRPRFGFAVGKRIGKAVVRNRVKRRLREAVRLRRAMVAPGWDVLFIGREPIVSASYEELDRAVVQLLQRARVARPPGRETGHETGLSGPD